MNASQLIKAEQIRHARESLGLLRSEAADFLGIQVGLLEAWETGDAEPDIEQLESLAAFYGRNLDFFLSEERSAPQAVYLRTSTRSLTSQFSIEVRRKLAKFEELCRLEWEIGRLSIEDNEVSLTTYRNGFSATDIAALERERLGLKDRPIRELRNLLTDQGIKVYVLDIPGDEFSGLSWWHDTYGPAMLVNSREGAGRRSFTMAHEFAHLLTSGTSYLTICDLSDIDSEQFANRFAVAFLMPEQDVKEYWRSRIATLDDVNVAFIGKMSSRYGVSLETMAIRLEELGLFANATWLVEHGLKPRTFGRGKPGWRRTRGEAFVRKANKAYHRGKLSLGKLAEYLEVDIRTALKVASEPEGLT